MVVPDSKNDYVLFRLFKKKISRIYPDLPVRNTYIPGMTPIASAVMAGNAAGNHN
jgi:hypothetical protein